MGGGSPRAGETKEMESMGLLLGGTAPNTLRIMSTGLSVYHVFRWSGQRTETEILQMNLKRKVTENGSSQLSILIRHDLAKTHQDKYECAPGTWQKNLVMSLH